MEAQEPLSRAQKDRPTGEQAGTGHWGRILVLCLGWGPPRPQAYQWTLRRRPCMPLVAPCEARDPGPCVARSSPDPCDT